MYRSLRLDARDVRLLGQKMQPAVISFPAGKILSVVVPSMFISISSLVGLGGFQQMRKGYWLSAKISFEVLVFPGTMIDGHLLSAEVHYLRCIPTSLVLLRDTATAPFTASYCLSCKI